MISLLARRRSDDGAGKLIRTRSSTVNMKGVAKATLEQSICIATNSIIHRNISTDATILTVHAPSCAKISVSDIEKGTQLTGLNFIEETISPKARIQLRVLGVKSQCMGPALRHHKPRVCRLQRLQTGPNT